MGRVFPLVFHLLSSQQAQRGENAVEQAAQAAGQNVLSPTQQIEQAKTKTKAVKSDYEQLKEDYEKLLEKCNSLLLENFELRQSTRTL